jgi:hypothetical protein
MMRSRRNQRQRDSSGHVMPKLIIALAMGTAIVATAAPITAEAHWRHSHRIWHHAWHAGPSYYPSYAFFDGEAYGPICVWHRGWDAYWHRDCF